MCEGFTWGLWHVPKDGVTGVIERHGFARYLGLYLPAFILGTISSSLLAAWAMDRVGGSVWPVIVVHGIGNDALGFSGQVSTIEALTPYSQITRAVPMMALAVLLIWLFGRRQSKQPLA